MRTVFAMNATRPESKQVANPRVVTVTRSEVIHEPRQTRAHIGSLSGMRVTVALLAKVATA